MACGDINNNGTDDLVASWNNQGIYVKYKEQNNTWIRLASPVIALAVGYLGKLGNKAAIPLNYVSDPWDIKSTIDLSSFCLGGKNFQFKQAQPGPGDFGFVPKLAPGYNSQRKTDKTVFSPKYKE